MPHMPIEPSVHGAPARRASATASRLTRRIGAVTPSRASAGALAWNVLVSMASAPQARYRACSRATSCGSPTFQKAAGTSCAPTWDMSWEPIGPCTSRTPSEMRLSSQRAPGRS